MTKEQAEEAAQAMDTEASMASIEADELDGSRRDRGMPIPGPISLGLRAEATRYRRAALALRAHWPMLEALDAQAPTPGGLSARMRRDALALARKEP